MAGARLKCRGVERGKDAFLPVYKSCDFPLEDVKYHLRDRGSTSILSQVASWSGNARRHGRYCRVPAVTVDTSRIRPSSEGREESEDLER